MKTVLHAVGRMHPRSMVQAQSQRMPLPQIAMQTATVIISIGARTAVARHCQFQSQRHQRFVLIGAQKYVSQVAARLMGLLVCGFHRLPLMVKARFQQKLPLQTATPMVCAMAGIGARIVLVILNRCQLLHQWALYRHPRHRPPNVGSLFGLMASMIVPMTGQTKQIGDMNTGMCATMRNSGTKKTMLNVSTGTS